MLFAKHEQTVFKLIKTTSEAPFNGLAVQKHNEPYMIIHVSTRFTRRHM